MKRLHIAEIRGTILDVSSNYPIAVHGAVRQGYLFYQDAEGRSVRRYVAEGADPDKGRFALEHAAEEMEDIQRARQTAFRIRWELITEEAFLAARKKKDEETKRQGEEETKRVRLLAEAEAQEAAARERAANLRVGLPAGARETGRLGEEAEKPKAQRARPKALSNLPV